MTARTNFEEDRTISSTKVESGVNNRRMLLFGPLPIEKMILQSVASLQWLVCMQMALVLYNLRYLLFVYRYTHTFAQCQ